jgi:hypothetical protein
MMTNEYFIIYFAMISLWIVYKLIYHKHIDEDIPEENQGFFGNARKQMSILSIILGPIIVILLIMLITNWICKEIKI